jgi:hypothetical protein
MIGKQAAAVRWGFVGCTAENGWAGEVGENQPLRNFFSSLQCGSFSLHTTQTRQYIPCNLIFHYIEIRIIQAATSAFPVYSVQSPPQCNYLVFKFMERFTFAKVQQYIQCFFEPVISNKGFCPFEVTTLSALEAYLE